MISKNVALQAHRFGRDGEVVPQEFCEDAYQLGIGVRERDGTAALLALGPIEHATRCVRLVADAGPAATVLLVSGANKACRLGLPLGGGESARSDASAECLSLFFGELHIAHPSAD